MNAVAARGIRKRFGDVTALGGVDVTIRAGEFYGLLGPNGAGKTTLLRILSGLMAADEGTLEIGGNVVLPHRRRSSMGVVPQEIALYDMLTATANLHVFGAVQGLTGVQLRERIGFVLDAVGLTERAHSRVKTFSGGMKRRLNLAVGLLSDPEVLLLDEPTVGVDPQSRASIFALLRSLNESGKTILYTTHYMEEAERLCGRIGILDHGQLLAEGTLTELVEKVELPRTIRVSGTAFMESPPKLKSAAHRATHDAVEYIPRDPSQLGAVVRELEESRTVYDRLEVIGPNLETLFLQLTGRELRN